MAIYAISDLHLSFMVDKPMDVFGPEWKDYENNLKENWNKKVKDEDYVLIPGDISWGMYLDEITEDFKYINDLKGKKIISKGNHDYWWETTNKLNKYIKENSFDKIAFLNNNSYKADDYLIVGTKGYMKKETKEDLKIYNRELIRFELSINDALSKRKDEEIIAMLHYPPVSKTMVENNETNEFIELLIKYDIHKCLYGHLHGSFHDEAYIGTYKGIDFKLISADYLKFDPIKIV